MFICFAVDHFKMANCWGDTFQPWLLSVSPALPHTVQVSVSKLHINKVQCRPVLNNAIVPMP